MPNERSVPRFAPQKCRHGWTTCVYCGHYDPAAPTHGMRLEDANKMLSDGMNWAEPPVLCPDEPRCTYPACSCLSVIMPKPDPVNHPAHYTSHPSGVECITITRHHNFNVGNAIKYLWRAGAKGNPVEDLRKAKWYIEDEIRRLEGQV